MDRDEALSQRLRQMDSYFQRLVSLIPPQNYYSQTAEEEEIADIDDDLGPLAKVLKKPSHIKTISKDGKLIRPAAKEKRKQQEEKKHAGEKNDGKKVKRKKLMRREDLVEIIKKQKADDSGIETIGSVDLDDGKELSAKGDIVDSESSRLKSLESGKDQEDVDVTKSHNAGSDPPFEEGESKSTSKKEHKIEQFKVPEGTKQEKDRKIESVKKQSKKLNGGGEITTPKRKSQKKELGIDEDNSEAVDAMQMPEVSVEKKVVELEQEEKDASLKEREQNGEVEDLAVVSNSKVSSEKKTKNEEKDKLTEEERVSNTEKVLLGETTSELKKKKKRRKGKNDEKDAEEMVFDLADFKMSDLDSKTGEKDEGNEGSEDENKVDASSKTESQDFLALREKVRSKIEAFEMERKAKGGDEKKRKKKELKAKLKKMRKAKKKDALAVKKNLKKQEEGKNITQKVEEEMVKDQEEETGDNKLQFSQFQFDGESVPQKKKKSKKTKNMIENQTGKNYKVLLDKVEKKKEKYERLKDVNPELAVDWLSQEKWRKAVLKAQGEKIKDDPELLKKSLKRTEKRKKRSRQKMAEMKEKVLKGKKERQQKRNRNLQARKDHKKSKKTKRLQKKGKLLLGDRDKI